MSFSTVILAGGKSSRMGCDKAFLETGGQTLLARQIQLALETGAPEILISGRAGADYSIFGSHVLLDKFPDAGPLAGIERALDAAISPLLLVLAVDLPKMNADFLQRLRTSCIENIGVIPRMNGHIEPLAAFYPKAAQMLAEALLRNGHNAVATFAGHCARSGLAQFVDLAASDACYFVNLNTPADLPP